jgi:hypothetical protein
MMALLLKTLLVVMLSVVMPSKVRLPVWPLVGMAVDAKVAVWASN